MRLDHFAPVFLLAELERDAPLSAPLQHRSTRKLAAAVDAHRYRKTTLQGDPIEDSDDVAAAGRRGHLDGQAFARNVIDDHERAASGSL